MNNPLRALPLSVTPCSSPAAVERALAQGADIIENDAASTWAEQVNPALGAIGEGTVTAVHAAGMEINVWTVNGGQDMRRALAWQVDGIITNYPQVLAGILRKG